MSMNSIADGEPLCSYCAKLKDENRILRGLVQTNSDWKCPYGMDVPSIGHCPSGFPGCACADDRIAVLCEDGPRIEESGK